MRTTAFLDAARIAFVLLFVGATLTAARQAHGEARLDTAFELHGGESATIRGEALDVRFDRVVADSRCPRDARCIQAGDVRIAITLQKAGRAAETVELKTPSRPPASASYAGYRVELTAVTPLPEVGREVRRAEYVATLTVRRE